MPIPLVSVDLPPDPDHRGPARVPPPDSHLADPPPSRQPLPVRSDLGLQTDQGEDPHHRL